MSKLESLLYISPRDLHCFVCRVSMSKLESLLYISPRDLHRFRASQRDVKAPPLDYGLPTVGPSTLTMRGRRSSTGGSGLRNLCEPC